MHRVISFPLFQSVKARFVIPDLHRITSFLEPPAIRAHRGRATLWSFKVKGKVGLYGLLSDGPLTHFVMQWDVDEAESSFQICTE